MPPTTGKVISHMTSNDRTGRAPYQALTVKATSLPGALMEQGDDIPWTPFPDGTGADFKLLNVDIGSGGWTTIMRFPQGVEIPMHLHLGAVEIYTIRGSWSYQEGRLTDGGYAYEPSGVIHEPSSETEVELFIVSRGSNLYFDEDGRFTMWLDAHMLYTTAKANNAVHHLRHLDHLIVDRPIPT
ncbi:MAG TPA: 2,4'-dihydroxyacetophenone dioxygenase family protein [Pseudonocardiaceae bacterium]|jgi:quercetin dioxygenase-like cupin family protein|nr:2,4'-dihydroxyacetophenone dioxygenase family protein [Pseudonocardiaceae bacterium]